MTSEERLKLLNNCSYSKLTNLELDTIAHLKTSCYDKFTGYIMYLQLVYGVSSSTIKGRLKRISDKLGCKNNRSSIIVSRDLSAEEYYKLQGLRCK